MATSFLNDLMQSLGERGRSWIGWPRDAARSGDLVALGEALLSRRGEASGVALARTLLEGYATASAARRTEFLLALGERFGADREALDQAIAEYGRDPSARTILALQESAEPRRQELIRRLNFAPGGTASLIRMRADLVDEARARPELEDVDRDFVHLFSSWFNRGFLALRPIDWNTPAKILEKVIRYEAVHAIAGWDDLRNRLEPADRRCYAFFHPQLVDEPLIFVEVALTVGTPGAVAPLLDPRRTPIAADEADTAVFYSISNTQKGLGGVSFGHFLIKQVAEELQRDLPDLRTFVTLSPVPGFAAWLGRERSVEHSRYFNAEERAALAVLDQPGWADDPALAEQARRALLPVAAAYFLSAKLPNGRPVDPVARFHLGNGARLEALHMLGDRSVTAMERAHGLMVNYRYDLGEIERNHEGYAERGEIVAATPVRRLLCAETPARELVATS